MTIELVGILALLVAVGMWKVGGFTRRMLVAQVVGLVIFLLMMARGT